jgi:hypothetical protein
MARTKRFALRPAIGLVIEQQRIALSVVATTPLGRREVARELLTFGDDGPEPVLARMLEPWMPRPGGKKPRQKPWIQVGLPESKVFQAAVPITPSNRMHSPQNFFLEAVQATNLRAEDRVIDLVKIDLNKQQFACLSACPTILIADQVEILERLGLRIAVMEPAPMGLLRAGVHSARTPHGSNLSVRVFLGKKQALAMTVAQGNPLFWHGFDLPSGEESKAVLAAYSTLWMLCRHSRISIPIDTVVIHGRSDLKLSLEEESFRERTRARLIRCPEPDYDLGAVALGVALNNPLVEPAPVDLGRAVRSPVSIWDIFPWGELVVQGIMVAGVSLLLVTATLDIETRLRNVQSQSRSFHWLGDLSHTKLQEEKKSLEQRISTLDAFQKGRLDWSTQLRAIARDAPETTVITSLTGDAELSALSKSKTGHAKRQLMVSFSTPLAPDGSMPAEIYDFIAKLREEPALLKHFPNIEGSGLRTGTSSKSKNVTYSVVCLPRTSAAK